MNCPTANCPKASLHSFNHIFFLHWVVLLIISLAKKYIAIIFILSDNKVEIPIPFIDLYQQMHLDFPLFYYSYYYIIHLWSSVNSNNKNRSIGSCMPGVKWTSIGIKTTSSNLTFPPLLKGKDSHFVPNWTENNRAGKCWFYFEIMQYLVWFWNKTNCQNHHIPFDTKGNGNPFI